MFMNIPQPIPYQGSKRYLAPLILKYFPNNIETLIEPFAGSAAITVSAAMNGVAKSFHVNDINKPLIELLALIVKDPESISRSYRKIWYDQIENGKEYYNSIRNRFNSNQDPADFLYLLARCVKAAVRYNSNGEFNQSPDNRRLGKSPDKMESDIYSISNILKNKIIFSSLDYRLLIGSVSNRDLVYMDPPYQGVVNKRDRRYAGGIDFDEFISFLEDLNKREIMYLISYDGRRESVNYGKDLPAHLKLRRTFLDAGLSTQSLLLGRRERTYESLYISEPLCSKLSLDDTLDPKIVNEQQLLFA